MDNVDALTARDKAHRDELKRIGQAIGYGNAQSILGDLWDAMLDERYPSVDGVSRPGRGRIGVTVDDTLPPIPKAAHKRRSQRLHGGYEMVPAYTVAELKAFAYEAIKRDRLERDGDLRGVPGPLPETEWD